MKPKPAGEYVFFSKRDEAGKNLEGTRRCGKNLLSAPRSFNKQPTSLARDLRMRPKSLHTKYMVRRSSQLNIESSQRLLTGQLPDGCGAGALVRHSLPQGRFTHRTF